MKLWTLSNYGEVENTISTCASKEHIEAAMKSLDWNKFHQVVLEKRNGDMMEVGGSLSDDDLSVLYQEGEQQFLMIDAPTTIHEMTEVLNMYLAGNRKYKKKHRFA